MTAAWSGAAEAPTVDSILEKYIAASGGKAAMEKVTTRIMKGELEVPGAGAASTFELQNKEPNKQWSKVELPGAGEIIDGFDGKVAWSKSPFEGLRVKSGDELEKVKRDAEFQRPLKLKSLYPDLAYKGTETIDGEEARVLESKPSATSKERFYFSSKSGLMLRQQSEFQASQGAVAATINLGDYRSVDGVKYPHSMKFAFNVGGQEFTFAMQLKELRHNATVDDARFAKPSE